MKRNLGWMIWACVGCGADAPAPEVPTAPEVLSMEGVVGRWSPADGEPAGLSGTWRFDTTGVVRWEAEGGPCQDGVAWRTGRWKLQEGVVRVHWRDEARQLGVVEGSTGCDREGARTVLATVDWSVDLPFAPCDQGVGCRAFLGRSWLREAE